MLVNLNEENLMKSCKNFHNFYLTKQNYKNFILACLHYRYYIKIMVYFIYRDFMKRFYETNTITYNLMSFSAFKAMLIFTSCLEGPKSYEDLRQIIKSHPYLWETVSIDTIRIYINSLKKIGCVINRITEHRIAKYYIEKHPFELKINDTQVKSIKKIFNAIVKSIDFEDFIALTSFFEKFSMYAINEELQEELKNLSPLKNIDTQLIHDLRNYVNKKTEITVLYNSKNSGHENITILTDKLYIESKKLYLSGFNSKYQTYTKFPVNNILKIQNVNIEKPKLQTPELVVTYEYDKTEDSYIELLSNEKVIKETKNKYVIEITSKNKFDIIQRILFHANKCKVISPTDFQKEIISCLEKMKEGYFDKQ